MDKDEITVTDNNYRIHNDRMQQAQIEYEQEKLRRAELVEQARFERKSWLEKLLDKWSKGKKKVESNTPESKQQDHTIMHDNQNTR
ncbi:hypothetical protein HDR61_00275 [bacterium]|nr:hypothetical protein [bacterium]